MWCQALIIGRFSRYRHLPHRFYPIKHFRLVSAGGKEWGLNTQERFIKFWMLVGDEDGGRTHNWHSKFAPFFFCLLWGLEHRNQPRWRTSAFIGYHYAYQQWQRVHCTQFRTEPKGENLFSLSKVKPDRSAQSLLIVLSKIRDCHFQSYIYDAVLQSIPDQSMCFQSFT